jgi:hypothetical protein
MMKQNHGQETMSTTTDNRGIQRSPDGRFEGRQGFQDSSLSHTAPNESDADRLFKVLADWWAGADAADEDLYFPALR